MRKLNDKPPPFDTFTGSHRFKYRKASKIKPETIDGLVSKLYGKRSRELSGGTILELFGL